MNSIKVAYHQSGLISSGAAGKFTSSLVTTQQPDHQRYVTDGDMMRAKVSSCFAIHPESLLRERCVVYLRENS